jgi:hypothetical protein
VLMGEMDEVGGLMVALLALRGGKFVVARCACSLGMSAGRRP